MGKRGPAKGRPEMPLRSDPERQQRFLDCLEQTGSLIESARRASPHSEAGAMSSFRSFMRDSAEFSAKVSEALEVFRDSLVREAIRRGRDGVDRPIYQKGQLVGHERVFSDHLLTLELKKHHEGYRERTQHDHRVTIQPSGAWAISLEDLGYLSDAEKADLARIMDRIRDGRGERKAIEHHNEKAIEVEFSEVEEEPADWELASERDGND